MGINMSIKHVLSTNLPDPFTWIRKTKWKHHHKVGIMYILPANILHLGLTHMAMDAAGVATHRCLAPNHPVFRLLAPHFFYLFAINQ